jgi:hypothetical protein
VAGGDVVTATVIAAAALPMAATYLLLHAARAAGLSRIGSLALAIGLGLGLASCAFLLALILFDGRRSGVMAIDAAFLLLALAVRWRSPASGIRRPAAPFGVAEHLLVLSLVAASVAGAVSFLANTLDSPHGRWDAWATWNVRARWLAAAGAAWRDAVAPPAIHGDYPWLVPATVARLWVYAGGAPTAVPAAVAFAYAAALVALLYACLAALRGRAQALVAALCLLGTPLFLRIAPWQYADLPLAFNLLAALALLALYDRDPQRGRPLLPWAGVAAGLAAWTKNEGTMLVTAIVLVRIALMVRRRRCDPRAVAWFGGGLLLPGAAVLYFKLTLATPISLYKEPFAVMLQRALDAERYATILRLASYELARGTLPVLLGLALYAALLGRSRDLETRALAPGVAAVLAVAALVYFLTYLTARSALTWLVPYSVDRLTLHLWPSALLALCLYVASPAEHAPSPAAAPPRRPRAKASPRRRR